MKNEELSKNRLEICKKCPLWKETEYGPVCNNKKYINFDGKVSFFQKEGYKRGCNCRLLLKTKNPREHCIVEKW